MNRGDAVDRGHPYPRYSHGHMTLHGVKLYSYIVLVPVTKCRGIMPRIGMYPIRGIPTIHKRLRSA